MINPFSTQYLKDEIAFYAPVPYEKDGMKVYSRPIEGLTRIDEFLNKGFWDKGPDIPILVKDDEIWMSITWMEVQSHWLPIQRAKGRVLVGGLGMGYAALRFAAKASVDKVVVYETDARVIAFFEETKGHREEFKKIELIEADVRAAKGEYDFAYIDIYATLLPDELLEDAKTMFLPATGCTAKDYHFWGQELALLSVHGAEEMAEREDGDQADFFQMWLNSGKRSLMSTVPDYEFCRDLIDALGLDAW